MTTVLFVKVPVVIGLVKERPGAEGAVDKVPKDAELSTSPLEAEGKKGELLVEAPEDVETMRGELDDVEAKDSKLDELLCAVPIGKGFVGESEKVMLLAEEPVAMDAVRDDPLVKEPFTGTPLKLIACRR